MAPQQLCNENGGKEVGSKENGEISRLPSCKAKEINMSVQDSKCDSTDTDSEAKAKLPNDISSQINSSIAESFESLTLSPVLLERGARKKTPPASDKSDIIYKLKSNPSIDRKGRNATKDSLPTAAVQIPAAGKSLSSKKYIPLFDLSPSKQTYLQKSGGEVWVSESILPTVGQNSASWLEYQPPSNSGLSSSSSSGISSPPYPGDILGFSPRDDLSPFLQSPVVSVQSDHDSQGGSPMIHGIAHLLSVNSSNEIDSPAGIGMSPSSIFAGSSNDSFAFQKHDCLSWSLSEPDLTNLDGPVEHSPLSQNSFLTEHLDTNPPTPASPSGFPSDLVDFCLSQPAHPQRIESPETIRTLLTQEIVSAKSPETEDKVDLPISVQEINDRANFASDLDASPPTVQFVVVSVPVASDVTARSVPFIPSRVCRPIKPKPPLDTAATSLPSTSASTGILMTKKRNLCLPAKTNLENILNKGLMARHLKRLLLKFRQREDQLLAPLNIQQTILQAALGIKDLELAYVSCNLAMQWASSKGLKEQFLQFINHRDHNGRTALFYAAAYNLSEFVAYLLECGADANLSDETSGNSPLNQAAQCGKEYLETTKVLCEHNATNKNFQNKAGLTPLHQAVLKHNKEFADESGSVQRIIDSLPIVQCLLRNKAQTNIQDNEGKTVYHIAVEGEKLDLLKVLNRHWFHPDDSGAINLQDQNGRTPLHAVVKMQHLSQQSKKDIIQELISNGAMTEILDISGNRPIDLLPLEQNAIDAEMRSLLQCQWSTLGWITNGLQ